MKRYGNLWEKIITWENLVLAAKKAQKGKRSRICVQRFNFQLEKELLCLQKELIGGNYRPGGFHTHWISKPKPRLISAAPYRDRVVHHALMNILEPILDRHFHPHSFACRKGKGSHAAADALQRLMRKNKYLLQCDIRKYFPSIDHEILKEKHHRLIKGPKGRAWLMTWLPARAHDNGLFLIFSNGVGTDDDEIRTGNAMILDCYGRTLAETWKADDDMVIADLKASLRENCTGIRWQKTRRPELYALLAEKTGIEQDTRTVRFQGLKKS